MCVLCALSCQSLSLPGHRQTSVLLVLQGLGWLPLLFGPYKLQRAKGRGWIPASLLMSLETSQMFHWWCGLRSCCWRKLPGCCITAVPLHHTALGLSIICPYLLGQRPSLDPRIEDGYLGFIQLIFRTVVVVQRLHRCILVLFGSQIARH